MFAALENKEQASFYYALAALYLLPQLEAGFDQNWFSIATLLAGIAHVQVRLSSCTPFWDRNPLSHCARLQVCTRMSKPQVERIAEEQGVSKEIQLKGGAPSSATKMLSVRFTGSEQPCDSK